MRGDHLDPDAIDATAATVLAAARAGDPDRFLDAEIGDLDGLDEDGASSWIAEKAEGLGDPGQPDL